MFPFAVAARYIAVVENHHIPKLLRSLQIEPLAFTQHPVPVQRPEEFRNCGIGVLAFQDIPAFLHRSEQAQLVEHMGSLQMVLVSGNFVQLVETVVHPPVLH
ncbi:hypothetical protein D3C80_1354030 [compost metagenome]